MKRTVSWLRMQALKIECSVEEGLGTVAAAAGNL